MGIVGSCRRTRESVTSTMRSTQEFLRSACALIFAATMASGLPACGGSENGGGSGPEVCEELGQAAQRCGLTQSGGEVGGYCGTFATNTEYADCVASCIRDADCADVEALVCSFSTNRNPLTLNACAEDCFYQEHTCTDGQLILLRFLCDQQQDCIDGSDESGCVYAERFTCGSGDDHPWSYQCDGQSDCLDGSDERDCAELVCD
jgi:hypothetical protein